MSLTDRISKEEMESIERVVKNANKIRIAIEGSRMNESKRDMELYKLREATKKFILDILMKYPCENLKQEQ